MVATVDKQVSPASVIQRYLVLQLFGVDPEDSGDWKIFVGSFPDTDKVEIDRGICIYDTSGFLNARCMDGVIVRHPGININVRSMSYNQGYEKARNILDNLATVTQKVVEVDKVDVKIVSFSPTTDVIALGRSENRRRKSFSINGIVSIVKI